MNVKLRSRFFPFLRVAVCFFIIALSTGFGEARADDEVEISVFQDALAPYGNWVDHPDYGQVWYPTQVSPGWRPYTEGHWEYTDDYGWLWVSDHAWGWAPFHYGRWAWDDWYGWVWIPGRVWAPAWVVWRYGGGYTAWAPMPPTMVWQPGVGAETRYFDRDRDLDRDCWVAVRDRDVHNRYLRNTIIDPGRNHEVMRFADRFSEPRLHDRFIVNPGVPRQHIERAGGRRVEPVRIRELGDPFARPRHDHDRRELEVVRPRFRDSPGDEARDEEARAERASRLARLRPRSDGGRNEGRDAGDRGMRLPARFRGAAAPENRWAPSDGSPAEIEEARHERNPNQGRRERNPEIPGNLPRPPGNRERVPELPQGGAEPPSRQVFPGRERRSEPPHWVPQEPAERRHDERRHQPRPETRVQEPDAEQPQEAQGQQEQERQIREETQRRRHQQAAEQQQQMRERQQQMEEQRQQEQERQRREEMQRRREQAAEEQQQQQRERQDAERRRQMEAQRRQEEQLDRQQEIQQRREAARQMEQQQQMEMQRRQREQAQREQMMQQQRESARQADQQRQQQLEAQRRREEQMQRRQQSEQQRPETPRQEGGEGRGHRRERMDQR